VKTVTVSLGGQAVPAKMKQAGADVQASLQNRVTVKAGERLVMKFSM
jgi:hypothetical protein